MDNSQIFIFPDEPPHIYRVQKKGDGADRTRLQFGSRWLYQAGFREGDEVYISVPRPYTLVITVMLSPLERLCRAIHDAAVEAIRQEKQKRFYKEARVYTGTADDIEPDDNPMHVW